MKNIVVLGAPGSGKGTVSGRISDDLGIPHLSTGEIFRTEISSGTRLGKRVRKIVDSGAFVDDEIVAEIVKNRILRDDCSTGFLLDGYPRKKVQAEHLDELLKEIGKKLDSVIQLDVSKEELVRRLSGRRKCSECKSQFNVYTIADDSRIEECRFCGGELIHREDDKPKIVRKRLDIYEDEIKPIRDHYEKAGIMVYVNGEGLVEEVAERVKQKIMEND